MFTALAHKAGVVSRTVPPLRLFPVAVTAPAERNVVLRLSRPTEKLTLSITVISWH